MCAIVDILLVLVVLLIIILIWRGPTMLPRLGESLGKTVKGFRENVPGALSGDSDDTADSDDKSDTDTKSGT